MIQSATIAYLLERAGPSASGCASLRSKIKKPPPSSPLEMVPRATEGPRARGRRAWRLVRAASAPFARFDKERIQRAAKLIAAASGNTTTQAATIRRILPWRLVAKHLRENRRSHGINYIASPYHHNVAIRVSGVQTVSRWSHGGKKPVRRHGAVYPRPRPLLRHWSTS